MKRCHLSGSYARYTLLIVAERATKNTDKPHTGNGVLRGVGTDSYVCGFIFKRDDYYLVIWAFRPTPLIGPLPKNRH